MILDILKKPEDLIRVVDDRPGHDWRYSLDASKLRELGWQPKWNFEDALRETVNGIWKINLRVFRKIIIFL